MQYNSKISLFCHQINNQQDFVHKTLTNYYLHIFIVITVIILLVIT